MRHKNKIKSIGNENDSLGNYANRQKKGLFPSFFLLVAALQKIFIVIFISTSFLLCQLLFVVLAFLFREQRESKGDNVS